LSSKKSTVSGRYIALVGIGSFLLAIIFTFISEYFASRLNSIILSLVFLVFIVLINIAADLVGTAVTAASHVPFNAKAAKRIRGAPHGLQLIRNADRVANLTNDMMSDITTTVGGALGISIVVQIIKLEPDLSQFWLNILITALIAAVIVSGKAYSKKIALSYPDDVIFFVGRFLARVEELTGYSPFRKTRPPRDKNGE
jgi:Mg2+/Co2+ transporter CorB